MTAIQRDVEAQAGFLYCTIDDTDSQKFLKTALIKTGAAHVLFGRPLGAGFEFRVEE
jgi:hypothetical protein